MLVRQSLDTYIRITNDMGYIYNQSTKLDRMYNETGIDYLRCISRKPQNVEDIVTNQLLPLYDGVTHDELYSDFFSFLNDLQKM